MRIAIFTDTYTPEINGVALTLERYVNYLDNQGIEYRLFAPTSPSPVPNAPEILRLTSVPFLLYRNCRLALPNPAPIKQVLDDFKPNLIHIATPFTLGLCGLHYGKKHQIPMVASYHTHFDNYLEYYHLHFLKYYAQKYLDWFHRPFEKIYVPSQSTKEKLILQNSNQSYEIWSRGVDHHFFSPFKRCKHLFKEHYQIYENNIILYVGRIAAEKDIDIVLETFEHLPDKVKKDSHLVMVGDGPLFPALSSAHHDKVTWTGFIKGEALAQIYASSDLFLFPSPTETFGNVVLEALASGLPVITASTGGVKHLVTDKVTGYLCEPKQVDMFVERTTTLLSNPSLRHHFSKAARQFAMTQSWEHIFQQLIASFRDITKENQEFSPIVKKMSV
ncbi:glycosyltransferase family 4 protein [Amphibacillus cookii]|uniref:glycosyltransferase family 4 protein n=1 Tax=Amphibacillus cookii TaxID=767787 RepID=UPI00195E02C7|nr:glycosyltransferase family 1 protein [Amphibacillus cookii]MBM7541623.1 glycosyltransferase involved in cell wall biosynthesis [Amphibacillus cookii]